MERYSLTQVMKLLAVGQHRLKQLLAATGIEPAKASDTHGLVKLVTADEVERLRLALAGMLHPVERIGVERPRDDLAARVERLEAQVAQLLANQNAPSIRPRVSEAVAGIVERRFSEVQPGKMVYGQIGIGRNNAGRLAVTHGANSEKSARDWAWQEADLASESTALAFIKAYLDGHHAGIWHECERPECACHTS